MSGRPDTPKTVSRETLDGLQSALQPQPEVQPGDMEQPELGVIA